MKKLLLAAAAFAATLPAITAHAGEPVYEWTGFYVGLNAGYGWQGQSAQTRFSPNDISAYEATCAGFFGSTCAMPMSHDIRGGIGGAQIGYNWQFNPAWLVGIETDFSASGIEGSGRGPSFKLLGEVSSFRETQNLDWFGTLRGRIGFVPTNNLLIYGTGGLAYGRVTESMALDSTAMQGGSSLNFGYFCHDGANCFIGRSSRTATGWTVGAGFEYGVWKNVSLKAEYLYVDLDGGDTNVRALDAPSPLLGLASFTASHSPTRFNVARIGLNIKLGE